jgi:transposase
MSWPIGHAAWVVHAEAALPDPAPVLGIDETRRGRPVWVQNPDTGKWRLSERFETNLVDLAGSHGLLGRARPRGAPAAPWPPGSTSEGRSGKTRCGSSLWTRARPTGRRSDRRCPTRGSSLTTSISSAWQTKRSPTCAGGSAGTSTAGGDARPARRGPRGRECLSEKQFTTMWNDLIDGDASGQIRTAWIAKEDLRALLATAKTGG